MKFLRIFLLVLSAAVGYGVVHDQITARVCLEYFTIAHPPLVESDSPTVVGLAWGFVATWRLGAILGLAAALLARVGRWPKLSAQTLRRPVAWLLAAIAAASLAAGTAAYVAAELGFLQLDRPTALALDASSPSDFLAVRWAQRAAHGVAILGGGVLCSAIWLRRKRAADAEMPR